MNYKNLIEALLFTSPRPLTIRELSKIVEKTPEEVESLLDELLKEYEGRGIKVVKLENGYHFVTDNEFAPWIRKLHGVKKLRLSRAALEVLAIVALKQPITRAEINELRKSQTSEAVIKQLLEKGLIKIAGKKAGTGGAQLFETTELFLRVFNLKSIEDLPSFEEIEDFIEKSREPQLKLIDDET